MMQTWGQKVVSNPWKTLLAVILITVLVSAGLSMLTFRSDARVFFSHSNPELSAFEAFEGKYGRDDTISFIISARDGDLFTPARLAAIAEFTDQAWGLPDIKRVDSITNFQRAAAQGDDIVIDHVYRLDDPMDNARAGELKQAALNEPMMVGKLLSKDATVGLVAAGFRLPEQEVGTAAITLTAKARELAAQFEQQRPDLEVRLTGSLVLDNTFTEASEKDGSVLIPVMITVIFTLIWLMFRSWQVVLASMLAISAAIVCAMGVAGFLGVPLSSPSVVAPFAILTLATADCIHLSAAIFRVARDNPDMDRRAAVAIGMAETFRPIAITSFTTTIGFYSLIFSESPPFGHLGIIAGTGALFAWLFTITLLPALMALIPWRAPQRWLVVPDGLWRRLNGIVMRQTNKVIVIAIICGLGLAGFAFNNTLDDSYVNYFDQRFEFRSDTDYFNQHLGGFYRLEYSMAADGIDGVTDPEYLKQLDAFGNWLRSQPEVSHVTSMADIMKTVNRAMNGGSGAEYRLPEEKFIASQYLALYEMSLPMGLDLRETITVDKSESRLTVLLYDLSTREILALSQKSKAWLAQNAPMLASSANATGMSVLFSHIGQRNISQMLIGTLIAFVLIALLLVLMFRSWKIGAVAMVANFIPPLAALGGWALVVGELGMAVAAIVAVTLGIVVDDTIHIIEALLRKRAEPGVNSEQVTLEALRDVGPGVVMTTIILSMGFFCLAFSGFQINAWMGLMTAIVILIAFVFDLLLIPAVMKNMEKS